MFEREVCSQNSKKRRVNAIAKVLVVYKEYSIEKDEVSYNFKIVIDHH